MLRIFELKSILVDLTIPYINLSNIQTDRLSAFEVLLRKSFEATKTMQKDFIPIIVLKNGTYATTQVHQCDGKHDEIYGAERSKFVIRITFCQLLFLAITSRMMLTDNQQVCAKEALCHLVFKIHGFFEGQKNNGFPSVFSSSTDSNDDELNFEKHLDKLEKSKSSRLESVEQRNTLGATSRFWKCFLLFSAWSGKCWPFVKIVFTRPDNNSL